MKKQEFLEELKGYLKVLQDEEQEDILDEYSQHIEMKKERGLSEEEAIRDFGPVQQLAGEILQAYHVKPEYEKEMGKGKYFKGIHLLGKGMEEESREKSSSWRSHKEQAKALLGENGKKVRQVVRLLGRKIIYFLKLPFLIGEKVGKRWRKRKGMDGIRTEQAADHEKGAGRILRGTRRSVVCWIAGFMGCLFSSVSWCCRLGWNFCVLIATAGLVCLGLLFLFLFGGLSVLWMRGYPLAGVVLGCFGAVLCFAALSILSCTFFWVKQKGTARATERISKVVTIQGPMKERAKIEMREEDE